MVTWLRGERESFFYGLIHLLETGGGGYSVQDHLSCSFRVGEQLYPKIALLPLSLSVQLMPQGRPARPPALPSWSTWIFVPENAQLCQEKSTQACFGFHTEPLRICKIFGVLLKCCWGYNDLCPHAQPWGVESRMRGGGMNGVAEAPLLQASFSSSSSPSQAQFYSSAFLFLI